MLFHKSKKREQRTFDRDTVIPAVRASICTGERVAGFQNISTGKFDEVTLIRNEEELHTFMEQYGIQPSEIKKIY